MTPGQFDAEVVRRPLLAMDQALQTLRRHRDWSLADLAADRERAWVVERGLAIVHRLLLGDLEDFEVFARHVQRYLDVRRA